MSKARRHVLRYLSGLHQITDEVLDLPNESYPSMIMANLPPDNRIAACKLLKTTPTYVLYAEVDGHVEPTGTLDDPSGISPADTPADPIALPTESHAPGGYSPTDILTPDHSN